MITLPRRLADSRALGDGLVIVAAASVLLAVYGAGVRRGPALADEFVYLAGARHLAHTGRLDARYYDASAIVAAGHPHQDVHAPGYVLVLGALSALLGAGDRTALVLNAIAFAASGLLVYALARALEVEPARARLAALALLLLPGLLPYVFWAMAETVLAALVLAALVLAARAGDRVRPALAAGATLALAFLVGESALFALPALLALPRARARRAALAAFAAAVLCVYVPLSRHRAPGGANFWAPTSGRAFGYEAVQAAGGGRLGAAAALVGRRVAANAAEIVSLSTTWTERGILAAYVVVPLLALARWRAHGPRVRRYLVLLLAGDAVVVALLFGVYVVGQWSGYRYAMALVPPFLPLAIPRRRPAAWAVAGALGAAGAVLAVGERAVFDDYKASRQRRQAGLADYVERYVPSAPERIVLTNGWLYGWRHEGTEVVSAPTDPAALRELERAVGFDYLVVPSGSEIAHDTDGRLRYQRVNAADPEPPLVIYRRIR